MRSLGSIHATEVFAKLLAGVITRNFPNAFTLMTSPKLRYRTRPKPNPGASMKLTPIQRSRLTEKINDKTNRSFLIPKNEKEITDICGYTTGISYEGSLPLCGEQSCRFLYGAY